MPELPVLDALPEGFLDCGPRDLHRLLDGPTLIELPGRRAQPLFVSFMLHGNEDVGLRAVQHVLRALRGRALPRSLMLLAGNVEAARDGRRRQDHQPDFNRIWPGTFEHADTPEAALMAQAHARILARNPFAVIDLHNNTGLNPHYGVVCSLDRGTLQLASLFSRIAVWFEGMAGTQTASLAGRVPAIAAECGQPGVAANVEAAARFVDGVLHMADFPDHAVRHEDIDLYHTLAVVRVRPEVDFSFCGGGDLVLDPELDHMNFRELPAGTAFGSTTHAMPLDCRDDAGRDLSGELFTTDGGTLRLRRPATPAMLTRDARIVRQDCLCYLMERVPPGNLPPGVID
jgi:hypothetical protein